MPEDLEDDPPPHRRSRHDQDNADQIAGIPREQFQDRWERSFCRFINVDPDNSADRETVRGMLRKDFETRQRWAAWRDKGAGAIIVVIVSAAVTWIITHFVPGGGGHGSP